jgi:hypothetical protein
MKNQLLPRVKTECLFPLLQFFQEQSDNESIRILYKQVRKENPVVADAIQYWSKDVNSQQSRLMIETCGLIVYNALRSQAEADQMSRELLPV